MIPRGFLRTALPSAALFLAAITGNAPVTAEENKGVGPVSHVAVNPTIVDEKLAAQGKTIFETKCSACHKLEERYVGPALAGVTARRSPEWIMNMILNPQEMTQKDPVAQEMFGEYLIQMTFQNVSNDEARQILEYLRSEDAKKK